MYKYIIKRILIAIPVLIGITVIDYAIMCMAGSPLEMMQGPRVSQAALEAKKIALGLDKPFYVQYFVWLGQLLHGNLGYSIKSSQAVSEMIASHLGPTLLLMGISLIASLILAVPAGIYSAIHQYEKGDYAVVTASFLGSSIPGFFLSLLLSRLQQITAVQAENRPPVRVEVADGLQASGELLRLLQSGQKDQAVDLSRPAVLLINGADLPGHHKAGRRPCRSRVLHAAAGAQGIDTISAPLQRLCQLSPPSGVGKVPRPYEIDALAPGPEIQVGGVTIPAGGPGILGVNMQIRDKHGVPPFRRFSPSYLFQSRRARLLFSLPLFLLALETILW